MALWDSKQAKKGGGFAQVREALIAFKGEVVKVEDGQWGGKLVDEEGNPIPPKEFFEIGTINNVILEAAEELSMDIADKYSFRVNMSEFDGSFWVDEFLASADKFKLLLPDGLIGKVITFRKRTKKWERKGKADIFYTNYVIEGVEAAGQTPPQPKVMPVGIADPMVLAEELAIGKTEQQFRLAVQTSPDFIGSPILSLVKSGAITQSLVNEGKLVLVKEGNKEVYQRPE